MVRDRDVVDVAADEQEQNGRRERDGRRGESAAADQGEGGNGSGPDVA